MLDGGRLIFYLLEGSVEYDSSGTVGIISLTRNLDVSASVLGYGSQHLSLFAQEVHGECRSHLDLPRDATRASQRGGCIADYHRGVGPLVRRGGRVVGWPMF